jgi:ATP-binding cassette subfamily B (MDR/TAP) protein 1
MLRFVAVPSSTVQAVLRQDISWYDTTTTTDFASRMTDDLNKLEDGIGEKIGMLLHFLGIFLISHIGKTILLRPIFIVGQ